MQNIDLLQDLDAKFVDQLILAFKNVIFAALRCFGLISTRLYEASGCESCECDAAAALFQVTFAPGMTIMLKDAPVTELYVINSGVVEMVLASTHEARGAQALRHAWPEAKALSCCGSFRRNGSDDEALLWTRHAL